MKTESSFFPPADSLSHSLRRRWLGTWQYWLFQAAGWGIFWLVLTLGSLVSGSADSVVENEVMAQTVLTAVLLMSSHLLRIIILFLRGRKVRMSVVLPALSIAIVAAAAASSGPWLYWSSHYAPPSELPPAPGLFLALGVFLLGISLLLGVWVCLYAGYHYYIRYQQSVVDRLQLDAAVQVAELRALRAQINPHFLFNSLNTLRALIPRDLDRPREAITLLADLLRASLTMGQQRTITLAQELETVNNYLALEQMRFEERLRVRLSIAPEACTCVLPPFVLQTLVENALKFGVAPFEDGGDIWITATAENGNLELTVRNKGVLNAGSASTGVGLKNARARLGMLCGPVAGITLIQEGPCVLAKLFAPLRHGATNSLHS